MFCRLLSSCRRCCRLLHLVETGVCGSQFYCILLRTRILAALVFAKFPQLLGLEFDRRLSLPRQNQIVGSMRLGVVGLAPESISIRQCRLDSRSIFALPLYVNGFSTDKGNHPSRGLNFGLNSRFLRDLESHRRFILKIKCFERFYNSQQFTLTVPRARHRQPLHQPTMLGECSTSTDYLIFQRTVFVSVLPSWETKNLPHDE